MFRMILWILTTALGYPTSLVLPQHIHSGHGWEWIGSHKRKPQKKLVRTQHNRITGNSRVKWQRSILSARSYRLLCQPIRKWGIKLTSVSFKLSLTHYYILLHKQLYSLTHDTMLSHTHYYILLHKQLYSLTHATILSCINNYILSHTTILSHIHYYTLTYTYIRIFICVYIYIYYVYIYIYM